MSDKKSEFDIIIVGAGPAGLAASIFSARKGKKVILIEKGKIIAPEPRGETLHDDPILSELLGNGFMDSISLSKTPLREFYSPNPFELIKKKRKTPSIVFEWRSFIDGFSQAMKGLDIILCLESEVTDLIIDSDGSSDIVNGVVYKDNQQNIHQVHSKVVFACDGHQSIIGQKFMINYQEMNFPIIKSIMKNGNFESKSFKYFFIPYGALKFSPNFPPIILFLFPREDQNFEAGLMIQTDVTKKLGLEMPNESEIMQVWFQIKEKYPVFSQMVKGSSIIYEKLTAIPMTGPIPKNLLIPAKGLVMVGDAAGFVEVSGGSGLVQVIQMTKIWSDVICEALDKNSGHPYDPRKVWAKKQIQIYEKKMISSHIYKHIKKIAKKYNYFRDTLFYRWRTKEKIMKKWSILKFLYHFI